jgi:putative transcriptional regulator
MVDQMASAFSSIKQGLSEAIEFSEGKVKKAIVHEFGSVDVKNIRAKVGMSQNEFASAFGISVSTLRHWERGDRTPQGPALVLLNVVAKEPDVVLRALAS